MANIPISSFTAAANATGIGMSGFSLTGANAQSMLDLAGTWNTSGTPTGLKLNVTDTASNAASLLMDLQVGGSSRFSVTKAGSASLSFSTAFQGFYANVSGEAQPKLALRIEGTQSGQLAFGSGGANVFDTSIGRTAVGTLSVGTNPGNNNANGTLLLATLGFSSDTLLTRDAANTLAQRNGVNAQAFRVYNTFTDASNYERVALRWTSNVFFIGSERAGTGTQRAIAIGSDGGAGSLIRLNTDGSINFFTSFVSGNPWNINASGHFVSGTDNSFDIGASGANRPRFLYLAGGSLTGTQADSSLSITPTWNTTGTPSAIDLNVTDTASNASSNLLNLRVGGGSQFRVRKDGSVEIAGGIGVGSVGGNQNFYAANNIGGGIAGMQQSSAAIIGWVSGIQAVGTADLVIRRDAANTLAQRNGTAAQAFNIYNTFTDASNYERGFVRWTTNVLQIGTEALGTGTARDLRLVPAMNNNGNVAGQRLQMGGATFYEQFGYLTMASTGNGLSVLQNLVVGGNIEQSAGKFIQMGEGTAPAAPAVNTVRIYAEDNGSGKTRLMALFATGVAQQIAIEP